MGNTEILRRGDVQLTSAGTGISHSEKTFGSTPVHFLQIWSLPTTPRLKPKYFTRFVTVSSSPRFKSDNTCRHFTDAEKRDSLVRVVASIGDEGVSSDREGSGAAPVQSPLSLYASLLSPSASVSHVLKRSKAYIHVVQTSGYNTGKAAGASVRIPASEVLREGDGAYIIAGAGSKIFLENVGEGVAEVLLFDLE